MIFFMVNRGFARILTCGFYIFPWNYIELSFSTFLEFLIGIFDFFGQNSITLMDTPIYYF